MSDEAWNRDEELKELRGRSGSLAADVVVLRSQVAALQAENEKFKAALRRAIEALKGARCPAVLDNGVTKEWTAWYDERDAILYSTIEALAASPAPLPTPPAGPELPTEALAILRDPSIPLESDEEATNFLLARGLGVVIGRGCKACMAREFPYWHPADRPCPVSSDTPPTPPAGTPPDPYCSLAASEIPGFGTNRDKHHCAKAHRDKPLPAPAVQGEPPRRANTVPGLGFVCWEKNCKLAHPHEDPAQEGEQGRPPVTPEGGKP